MICEVGDSLSEALLPATALTLRAGAGGERGHTALQRAARAECGGTSEPHTGDAAGQVRSGGLVGRVHYP